MRALLDTHTFLWWNMDSPMLSKTAREIIGDGSNELFLSAASAWEIAIKYFRGRLALPTTPDVYIPDRMANQRIQPLAILISHAIHVYKLPEIHLDPFDRLLIAQCQLEDLPLLTADLTIARYEINVIW
jgi:PIN domain nuclease of toxin-antitoxin system